MDLFEDIRKIVCEELGVEPVEITPETTFVDDLGADLPDLMDLVIALEENYVIEIPDEDAKEIKTVGDLVRYVEKKINQF